MRNCKVVVASANYLEASRLAKLIRSEEVDECTAVELKDESSIGYLTERTPDLIILDHPQNDEQRLRQIRQIKQAAADAIIVVLYRTHDFSRLGALAGAGVSSCVRKPPFDKELSETIRGIVRFWIGPSSLPYRMRKSCA